MIASTVFFAECLLEEIHPAFPVCRLLSLGFRRNIDRPKILKCVQRAVDSDDTVGETLSFFMSHTVVFDLLETCESLATKIPFRLLDTVSLAGGYRVSSLNLEYERLEIDFFILYLDCSRDFCTDCRRLAIDTL
jgi:hypothetical protein